MYHLDALRCELHGLTINGASLSTMFRPQLSTIESAVHCSTVDDASTWADTDPIQVSIPDED